MRGGAIPLIAWGLLLLVLFIGNWIWDAKAVNAAEAAFGALSILLFAAVLILVGGRRTVRRGPPGEDSAPHALPQASLGAVLVAFSFACILFGLVWASFLIYFGAGALLLSLGRVVIELRAQRESLEYVRGHPHPAPNTGPDGVLAEGARSAVQREREKGG